MRFLVCVVHVGDS